MLTYSLIVCTYNRSDLLKETIESVLFKLKDHHNFELLVVDNNSTDETRAVVQQFSHVPHLKYFLETAQGLSFARNRGLREARHDIVVFLDDDIDLEENYLAVCDACYRDPDVHIVGGKVLPYRVQIPAWLPAKFHYLASVYDLGDAPSNPSKLMGANHSFRKELVNTVGFYNTQLGPIGNYKIGGDEDEFLRRAQDRGYKLYYVPALVVYHKIANRLNEAFIYMYAANIGTSEAKIEMHHRKLKFLLKSILSVFRIMAFYLYGRRRAVPAERVGYAIKRYHGEGYLREGLSRVHHRG